ncbi:histidinol-phosphate transaminase [Brachyspira hyodysenteriae]|nr:histidinol-phosphate transaminase [Brachyspira hyodysenteriae]MDA0063473.1 histidinol-phosphate transaminase [Brachyspira hyodysenteriae]MDA0065262.1 histidinol-phosphate transaminase [Brachyspira hyodysenteriae]MDA0088229.1 histidinol-phosphate transaminase [Brachyspira hyodysenteriae]MDA0094204.1 histidinol-phosphate transaminase [Brachyspira hyodysenteriae]
MSKFLSDKAKSIEPYTPGEQPKDKNYIKLNTNESPYPPSPYVKKVLIESNFDDLRLYPDPNVSDLKKEIAELYNVNTNNIFIGNGSDEILAFSFMAFFNKGDKVYYPNITYSFYSVYSSLFDLNEIKIPLKDDFTIDINNYKNLDSGIFIANPNAPTGLLLTLSEIEEIVMSNKNNIVIIDEAYIDFAEIESACKLVSKYDNLLVIQTFSKSRALAGIRLGFAIGNENLIQGLKNIKYSFNSYTINRLSIIAGIEAIKDNQYFKDTVNKVINTREKTKIKLKELGFNVLDSKSNFIFISHKNIFAEDIYLKLKDKGILVRYFKSDLINNYIRVTIGTDEEMDIFVEKIKYIIKN